MSEGGSGQTSPDLVVLVFFFLPKHQGGYPFFDGEFKVARSEKWGLNEPTPTSLRRLRTAAAPALAPENLTTSDLRRVGPVCVEASVAGVFFEENCRKGVG